MHGRNLSEHALVHKVHYLYVTRVEQTLLPCKEDTFGGQVLVVHVEALLHIIAYTLFAIHMLAGVECVHYYLEMRIQRRCHDNGVYCLVVEQPAVVLVSLCVRSYGFGRVERRLVNVGQCHYVGLGILCQETHKKLTARARPYYAEAAAFLACFPHL